MREINKKAKIFAILDDLIFSSKIREASKSLNAEIYFFKTEEGLLERVYSERPSAIIFDLNSKKLNALNNIKAIKSGRESNQITIIGYFSHVYTELKQQASNAGCDVVFPRSKFSRDLVKILQNLINQSAG